MKSNRFRKQEYSGSRHHPAHKPTNPWPTFPASWSRARTSITAWLFVSALRSYSSVKTALVGFLLSCTEHTHAHTWTQVETSARNQAHSPHVFGFVRRRLFLADSASDAQRADWLCEKRSDMENELNAEFADQNQKTKKSLIQNWFDLMFPCHPGPRQPEESFCKHSDIMDEIGSLPCTAHNFRYYFCLRQK